MFSEYALQIAAHAHRRGVKVVVASGAYMNPEPMKELAKNVDGMCLALKGFTEEFYRDVIGARLRPVLDALVAAKEAGVWLEVTTLVIPDLNDDPAEIRDTAQFIAQELGRETPWHISRFFPSYEMTDRPPTPMKTLTRAADIGLEQGLHYVYLGNAAADSNTYCHRCGQLLIRRQGYWVMENNLRDGGCPSCGEVAAGVWG